MTVKLPIYMPKDCWHCKFAQKNLVTETSTCWLIFLFRKDVWDPPCFIQIGEKDAECPLIEVEDDTNK